MYARGLIEISHLHFHIFYYLLSRSLKSLAVELGDFLAHDPIRHGVDVGSDDVTPQAIGL